MVYTAVVSWREMVDAPFVRDVRLADWTDVPVVPARAVTRRVAVGVAARAAVFDVVPARAVVDVFVRGATRRVVVDVVARRGTTLRVAVPFDLVRVKTLICAFDCDGLTPGFKLVRMVLFIYGYKLL